MKYRYIGRSGLAVSKVCLGTLTFGQSNFGCNEETASVILNSYVEQGGNFINTADKYGDFPGVTEQIIGRWLVGRARDELVIASKCFFETGPDINARGLSRKHIISACEASLKRLGTDYIDLYQIHRPDPQTPLEETLSALDMLVKQGKVRYIGCSDLPAWQVTKATYLAERAGMTCFISGEYLYNLLKRDIEAEILPACSDSGIGVLCWSPLSGGLLTGKYKGADLPPSDSRMARRVGVTTEKYRQWQEHSAAIVNEIIRIADRHHVTPTTVTLAWLLHDLRVASVIVGARYPAQILDACAASEWELPTEDWSALEALSHIKHSYPHESWVEVTENWFSRIG